MYTFQIIIVISGRKCSILQHWFLELYILTQFSGLFFKIHTTIQPIWPNKGSNEQTKLIIIITLVLLLTYYTLLELASNPATTPISLINLFSVTIFFNLRTNFENHLQPPSEPDHLSEYYRISHTIQLMTFQSLSFIDNWASIHHCS